MQFIFIDKKPPGKSKEEAIADKKQELERRLLDVNDKIGSAKKAAKKGTKKCFFILRHSVIVGFYCFITEDANKVDPPGTGGPSGRLTSSSSSSDSDSSSSSLSSSSSDSSDSEAG